MVFTHFQKFSEVAKSQSNLFLLHGLQGGFVSSLFAVNESSCDISSPLDLTSCDYHLKQEEIIPVLILL